jgi:hypothetical protein
VGRRKASGWHLSIGVRLSGYYTQLSFYPLGAWSRLLLITAGEYTMTPGWHLMVGPFHAHGYYLGWKLIELEIDVSHDPFWGGAIRVPAGHNVIFGKDTPDAR